MKKSEFYVLRNAVHLQECTERHPQGSATLCSVVTLSKNDSNTFFLCVHLLEFYGYMVTLCLRVFLSTPLVTLRVSKRKNVCGVQKNDGCGLRVIIYLLPLQPKSLRGEGNRV